MKSALEIDGLRELGTHHLASLRTRIPLGATANGCYVAANMEKKLAELVAAGKITPYIQPAE